MSESRLIEQRSIDYVPIRERHGKLWHLWPVWFTGGAHLATIATGFVGMALGDNLVWMTIAVLLGCAFGTFFMAFHSTQGPQLGLRQMIQSRPQFGYLGALLVWCVALVTFVGHNAFNQVLAADTVVTGLSVALKAAGDAVLPGSGSPFLVASLLGLVTITTLQFYSASLTLLSVADSIRPLTPTVGQRLVALVALLAASCVIALASSPHFATQFGEFLAILLYLFTPWTAINLVDFYYVRRGHYSVREIFNRNGMYGRWNWRGLVAYFGGFTAMIPFFSTGIYRGPVAEALGGADIAMLVGLPVSTVIYLIASRSLDLEAEIRLVKTADQGLDPDA